MSNIGESILEIVKALKEDNKNLRVVQAELTKQLADIFNELSDDSTEEQEEIVYEDENLDG